MSPEQRKLIRQFTAQRVPKRNRGQMNGTEAAYAQHLHSLKEMGAVLWFRFEPMTLILAPDCRYTPDFLVCWNDGRLTCDEIKGFERDDAVVKFRTAAEQYPMFHFRMIKKTGTGWEITRDME